MRVVVQRVNFAEVIISEKTYSSIGKGLLVLCGFEEGDTNEELHWIAGKISRLRVFNDSEGVMNLSVQDVGGEIMSISQFTLHASTRKGNRPSYIRAMEPSSASAMYDLFNQYLAKESNRPLKTGIFGAYMKIKFENDGPVTIIIDSRLKE